MKSKSKEAVVDDRPTFQEFIRKKGRPTKYSIDVCERLFNYFNRPYTTTEYIDVKTVHAVESMRIEKPSYFPTIEGFCCQEMIGYATFYRWVDQFEDFRDTYEWCRKRQKDMLAVNLMNGTWSGKGAHLVATNYTDMREKEKVGDTGNDGKTEIRLAYSVGQSTGKYKDKYNKVIEVVD